MNSCFKIFVAFLFIASAHAVQVEALYTSLCERHVGMTTFVDKRFAHFLTVEGELKKVPRYQVLSVASYPLDHFPLEKDVAVPGEVPQARFLTLNKGELTLLAQGFVLGSNISGFQLLTSDGNEVFISRESIWKIELVTANKVVERRKKGEGRHDFSHPQRGQCKGGGVPGTLVHPSELVSDPVSIKRRFDAQISAYKEIKNYEDAQTFYAVPQVYKNRTSIGYWLPAGNRYGSSDGRVAGIAPLIRNELSKGPFSYQHLSLTGAGPVPDSIHEEVQTMLYYGFKSSYIHFAGFIDPSLILAGVNYQWQEDDLSGLEERAVESSYLALGFDRGPVSLTFFLNSHLFGAFEENGEFHRYDADVFRVGLGYRTSRLELKLNSSLGGTIAVNNSDTTDWNGDISLLRLSGSYELSSLTTAELFYLARTVSAKDDLGPGTFKGESRTTGLGAYYKLGRRWNVGGRASLEKTSGQDRAKSNDGQFFKTALQASLNF